MKLVRQTTPNGCVPATLAMLTGLTPKHLKTLFPNKHQWQTWGTTMGRAVLVLRRLGYRVTRLERPGKSPCMLSLSDPHGRWWGGLHLVAWDGKRVLDPGRWGLSVAEHRRATRETFRVVKR